MRGVNNSTRGMVRRASSQGRGEYVTRHMNNSTGRVARRASSQGRGEYVTRHMNNPTSARTGTTDPITCIAGFGRATTDRPDRLIDPRPDEVVD